jgi:ubiquinone/menaquinone biosynthesis C-methylase UbiE
MTKIADKLFVREDHTCPWWLCFTFDNPVRNLFHNPYKILSGYINPGDTVLDIGPGMGYFTFPISKMAGPDGKVIALDIQEGMLKRLEKKVLKNRITNISIKLYDGSRFALEEKFDFILLFWMYHEVNNKTVFINEINSVMKPGAKILIAEPKIHVNKRKIDESVKLFTDNGFKISGEPHISLSRAVLLEKNI